MRNPLIYDFDAIEHEVKRLSGREVPRREEFEEKELDATAASVVSIADIDAIPLKYGGTILTTQERARIAAALNCRWNKSSCGKNNSKKCLIRGKCMSGT